jgi:anti-sigma B factor antagonist
VEAGNSSIQRCDRPDAVRLVVEGEVDLAEGARLQDELQRLIADARSPAIVDLSGVTFFNSTGIGALVTAQRSATARGVRLVVEVSPSVRRVLEICGLTETFEHCT